MKRIISMLTIIAMVSATLYIPVFADETETIEYIVRYETVDTNGIQLFSVENEADILEQNLSDVSNIDVVDDITEIKTQLITLETADSNKTLEDINNIPGVAYAEPNYKVKLFDNDPLYASQVDLSILNPEPAWAITEGSSDVVVAVIDTGIDISHPDLAANIYTSSDTANGADNDGNGYVDDLHGWDFANGDNSVYDTAASDYHGTEVAGIIVAAHNGVGIQGVAPNIKILPLKFISENGGTVFGAIKAIEYARSKNVKIANCSWGFSEFSYFLYDAMKQSGILFACAAGNDGADVAVKPSYPAAYDLDNIISVASIDYPTGNISSFSNYGVGVDIAAPGNEILSTVPTEMNPSSPYGENTGTSMASPFVAGSASLLKSADPNLTIEEMKSRILRTVTSYPSALTGKVDTAGIVNAGKLLVTTCVPPVNLPSARYGAEYIMVGNYLYAMEGYNNGTYNNMLTRYVPSTGQWTNMASLGSGAVYRTTVSYNDKLYGFGGYDGGIFTSAFVYNPSVPSMSSLASMPEGLYASASAVVGDKIYIFGGIGFNGYSDKVYEYNITSNTWSTKNNMPTTLAFAKAVNADGVIYLIGGVNDSGVSDAIYIYNPESDTVIRRSTLYVPRKEFGATYFNGKIYIFGGSASHDRQGQNNLLNTEDVYGSFAETLINSVECYNPDTNRCEKVDTLTNGISGLSAVNYYDTVYLFGGYDGTYQNTATAYFGTEYPKDVRINQTDTSVTINWNKVENATGYQVEIDGTSYTTTNTTYTATITAGEHSYRVRAVKNSTYSLWSDYIYRRPNSALLDAKVISPTSTTIGKLYKSADTRWYKICTGEIGTIDITLSNIPSEYIYDLQLRDSAGDIIANGVQNGSNFEITGYSISAYNYYITVHSSFGGDATNAFTLATTFTAMSAADLPDRVKNPVVMPPDDNLPFSEPLEEIGEGTKPAFVLPNYTLPEFEINGEEQGEIQPLEIIVGGNPANATTITINDNSSVTQPGTISASGEWDFYKVATGSSTAKKLSIYATSPSGLQYEAFIFDHTGSSSSISSSQIMAGYRFKAGESFGAIKTTSSRNYIIGIHAVDNTSYSTTKSYTLKVYKYTVSTLDSYEVNDTASQADAVTSITSKLGSPTATAQPISFKMDYPGDMDMFPVSMNAGDKITVQMTLPSGYIENTMQYRTGVQGNDSSGTNVIRVYSNGTNYSQFTTFIAEVSGTFYVSALSWGRVVDTSLTGTLKISKTPSANKDGNETKSLESSNDHIAVRVSDGSSASLYTNYPPSSTPSFDNEFDVDWYKYSVIGEKNLSISITGNANMVSNAGVCIADSSYNTFAGGGANYSYNLKQGGTYYIAVFVKDGGYSSFMSTASNRNYTITVTESTVVNAPQIAFQGAEENKFYIFDDHPEHIRPCDVLDPSGSFPARALMHTELTPGTYTAFSYHHVDSSFDGQKVYFDAVFYDTDGSGADVKIKRMGLRSDWGTAVNAPWNSFKNGEGSYKTFYVSDNPNQSSDAMWLSSIVNKDTLINPGNNGGVVHLIMEFEVTGGNINYATVAYKNKSTAKTAFGDNGNGIVSVYEDLTTVNKGKGDSAQMVYAEPISYVIDDNTSGFLPVTISNDAYTNKQQGVFTTHAKPVNDNNRASTPISSIIPLRFYGMGVTRNPSTLEETGYEPDRNWYFDDSRTRFVHTQSVPSNMQSYFGSSLTPNQDITKSQIKSIMNGSSWEQIAAFQYLGDDGDGYFGVINTPIAYELTYEYNVTVKNTGNNWHNFSYIVQGDHIHMNYNVYGEENHDIQYDNILQDDNNVHDTASREVFGYWLKPGETINCVIRITMVTSSNPSIHNAFVVDATESQKTSPLLYEITK